MKASSFFVSRISSSPSFSRISSSPSFSRISSSSSFSSISSAFFFWGALCDAVYLVSSKKSLGMSVKLCGST